MPTYVGLGSGSRVCTFRGFVSKLSLFWGEVYVELLKRAPQKKMDAIYPCHLTRRITAGVRVRKMISQARGFHKKSRRAHLPSWEKKTHSKLRNRSAFVCAIPREYSSSYSCPYCTIFFIRVSLLDKVTEIHWLSIGAPCKVPHFFLFRIRVVYWMRYRAPPTNVRNIIILKPATFTRVQGCTF